MQLAIDTEIEKEETVKILICGDFFDGDTAKIEEVNRRLVESLGLSVDFLRGDVHYQSYFDQLNHENEKIKGWIKGIHERMTDRMTCTLKRFQYGLLGKQRHETIKAMRKGKNTCQRSTPEQRQLRRSATGLLSWAPTTLGNWVNDGRVNTLRNW